MKTIAYITVLAVALLTASCEFYSETDRVTDGEDYIGKVFEVKGDFLSKNNWELYYTFPSSFKVYDTDIVLVYLLWETTTDSYGKSLDVWKLLPQNVLLSDGILQYNFDYTKKDVKIYLDGTTDFSKLLPAETNNQVFRVVVLPAEFAKNNSVDIYNFQSIIQSPKIRIEPIGNLRINN